MQVAVFNPFARIEVFTSDNSLVAISEEEVQAFHEEFLQALNSEDLASRKRCTRTINRYCAQMVTRSEKKRSSLICAMIP